MPKFKLEPRLASPKEKERWLKLKSKIPVIPLDSFAQSDLEALVLGIFSPLKGFMTKKDYQSVLKKMRLASGELFSLPVTLRVDKKVAQGIKEGEKILLAGEKTLLAGMLVEEIFQASKKKEALAAFGTDDEKHPGVARLYSQGEILLGGKVWGLTTKFHDDFQEYRLTPQKTREIFAKRGWKTVAGFQTRNPIHRAHEYLIKTALEIVDGVLIHPLVGDTKEDDIPSTIRLECYEALIQNYFPKERVVLAVNPCSMRYAGPREAIFHALVRRNYGCTHFIVGRDHAGVGNYYGSYEAQELIAKLPVEELGIIPLFFEHAFYCSICEGMATAKTCPHPEARVSLSGTQVRESLKQGKPLPPTFTRKEVSAILQQKYGLKASA